MQRTMTRADVVVEKKRVSISSKRQVTIPQRFYTELGFGNEAECILRNNELIIRPIKDNSGEEFSEQILEDLLSQGYSGNELLSEFRKKKREIRPAVEQMLEEARLAAEGKTRYYTMDDVFGEDEDE